MKRAAKQALCGVLLVGGALAAGTAQTELVAYRDYAAAGFFTIGVSATRGE